MDKLLKRLYWAIAVPSGYSTPVTSEEVHQHAPTTPAPEQMLSAIVGLKNNPTKQPDAHTLKNNRGLIFCAKCIV